MAACSKSLRSESMQTCPVTYRGKTYPSIKAAASAIGCNARTIHNHLERYGHIDRIGANNRLGNANARRKPVIIGGMRFDTITNAAHYIGVSRHVIGRMVNGKASPAARDLLTARLMRAQMEGRKHHQSP